MADEFNPQGVDQTPRNNENPNSTADTGNAEPKNPFVGGDSVDAGNASDSSEQQAPVSSAALAADQQPTQAATDTAATEPIPDYASAKGESTVVSSSPASPAAPAAGQTSATTPLYRPAPEYGAYGPTPTQAQGQQGGQAGSNAQPTQQFPFGQPAQQTPQGQQGNRNPYYTNNPQPQGNGNPFNPPTQPQQNNGNPFASQSGQNGRNGQQPQQGGLFGFGTPGTGTPNGQGPAQPGQPGQPGPAKQGMSKTASNILIAVVAAVLAAGLCLGLGYGALTSGLITLPTSNSLSNVSSNKSGSGSATAKSGEAPDWQTVASDVSGSVVSIQTALSNGTAKGSGAIIDTEGHIITNNHVISGAQQIQVTLANGNMYSATLVGTDTTTDLAVIKLDNPPSDLKAVKFADSDKLAVGENVMAIGNPLGDDDTEEDRGTALTGRVIIRKGTKNNISILSYTIRGEQVVWLEEKQDDTKKREIRLSPIYYKDTSVQEADENAGKDDKTKSSLDGDNENGENANASEILKSGVNENAEEAVKNTENENAGNEDTSNTESDEEKAAAAAAAQAQAEEAKRKQEEADALRAEQERLANTPKTEFEDVE